MPSYKMKKFRCIGNNAKSGEQGECTNTIRVATICTNCESDEHIWAMYRCPDCPRPTLEFPGIADINAPEVPERNLDSKFPEGPEIK